MGQSLSVGIYYVVVGLVSALVLIGIVCYVGYLVWEAKQSAAGLPRVEAVQCDKHGLLPASSCVTLMDDELDLHMSDGTNIRKTPRMCPMCFNERIQEAKKHV